MSSRENRATATSTSGKVVAQTEGTGLGTSPSTTVSYEEQTDYTTSSGKEVHIREEQDETGVFRHREVEIRPDGSQHVHRVYENPNKGTRLEIEKEFSG
jgi:allantoicase